MCIINKVYLKSKPYNKSFLLEESNIYDYNVNDLNYVNNLPCNYELLTIAKKKIVYGNY